MAIINYVYDVIEDVANFGLDFFFKFKRGCLVVFMWMCVICTILTLNIFTGALAFFVFFYLKRNEDNFVERTKFKIVRHIK